MVVLVLLLIAVVVALVRYQAFNHSLASSNHRVPQSAKRVLAPPRDVLSHDQVLLITFKGASVFVRTDPSHELVSLLSLPGNAFVRSGSSARATFADAYGSGGTAGVIRFARSALGLRTSHVMLVEPRQIPALVDTLGGVHIYDRTVSNRPDGELVLTGAQAARYIANADPSVDAQRERALLDAIVTRIMSISSVSRLTQLARTLPQAIDTDLSPKGAIALALFRLRVRHLVECGAPVTSSLASPIGRHVLRRFLAESPVRTQLGSVMPDSGCQTKGVPWAGVPASIVSISSAGLTVLPFLPAIAIVMVVLDALLLLRVLRIPHALVAVGRAAVPTQKGRPSTLPRSQTSRSHRWRFWPLPHLVRTPHLARFVRRPLSFRRARAVLANTQRMPRARGHASRRRRRIRSRSGAPRLTLRFGIAAAMLAIIVGYVASHM